MMAPLGAQATGSSHGDHGDSHHCPRGWAGAWPHCRPPCPKGWAGTAWPRCRPPCPKNWTGSFWPDCRPPKCPPGMVPPYCERPHHKRHTMRASRQRGVPDRG
jgi:hypothetical protein